MSDYISHVVWYTVYDAKTGELVAAGTSAMCASKLGYKTSNSFASAASPCHRKKHRPVKYIFYQELVDREEIDLCTL